MFFFSFTVCTACGIVKPQAVYEIYFSLSPQCTKAVTVKLRCSYCIRGFPWFSNPHARYCFKC